MTIYPKINLHLKIGPRGPDGFHPLCSWMTTVQLPEQLTLTPLTDGQLRLTCSDASLACDQSNLVMRAALTLRQHAQNRGVDTAGASLYLEKQIPAGGGLGGGSADAAATLRLLNDYWRLNLSAAQLAELGGQLGSDVPFFFFTPSALCRGRGQRVDPLPAPAPQAVLLIFPPYPVSTAQVYQTFDNQHRGQDFSDTPPDLSLWTTLPALPLLAKLQNDLEPPAFAIRPQLDDLRQALQQHLRRPVRMSGSGSTLFTLYDTLAEARTAATTAGPITNVFKSTLQAAALCPTD